MKTSPGGAGTAWEPRGQRCSASVLKKTTLHGLLFPPALMVFLSHPSSFGASKLGANAQGSSCVREERHVWRWDCGGLQHLPGLPALTGGGL